MNAADIAKLDKDLAEAITSLQWRFTLPGGATRVLIQQRLDGAFQNDPVASSHAGYYYVSAEDYTDRGWEHRPGSTGQRGWTGFEAAVQQAGRLYRALKTGKAA